MRILTVVGTRPNFVKAAALLEEMGRHPEIESVLVHSGQHYDYEMSKTFFEDLEIPTPHVNLGVGSGGAVSQTAEIMRRLEGVIEETQPDVVVALGDVNSSLATALAAAQMRRTLAHVEAGLRSFDRTMPEEVNRVAIDALADVLFVTEPSGVENLLREGKPEEAIHMVGNVMIDALRRFLPRARECALPVLLPMSKNIREQREAYGVVTLHRPSTVDHRPTFRRIWAALQDVARELPLIFPVHPRTKVRIEDSGLRETSCSDTNRLHLAPPMSYLAFLRLQSEAELIITDSGGVQEESSALGVPCLTVRENTERPITLTEGTNRLVGLDGNRLLDEARKVLRGEGKVGRIPKLWDGHAATRIVERLLNRIPDVHDLVPLGSSNERANIARPQYRLM